MKKFSNITNTKVSEEPKIEDKPINEEEQFRIKVLNLMDQFLNIRTYGPVDRYLRAGNIKIVGQDLFMESLMDLLKEKSTTDEKRILESLKSDIKDWQVLDAKINALDNTDNKITRKNEIKSHKMSLQKLYQNYKHDDELMLKMIEESCSKIKDTEFAYLRGLAAEYMASEGKYPKNLFKTISKMYKNRSNELD